MSTLSTHVLDTARGRPAAGVPIRLYAEDQTAKGGERLLAEGLTDADGRVREFLAKGSALSPGRYRMHFDTGAYFAKHGQAGFYPYVDVVFTIEPGEAHYHVPLLLSPYGYSTYRGS